MKVLFLMGLVTSVAFAKPNRNPTNASLFKDTEKGFSIELPKGWDQQKNVMGATIIAALPAQKAKDKDFQPNLNVVVEKLSQKISTQDYVEATQNILAKVFQDYKFEKKGEFKAGTAVFRWNQFTHKVGPVKARVRQYMCVKGNQAYIVTTTTADRSFEEYVPTFEKSLGTFKFEGGRKLTQE